MAAAAEAADLLGAWGGAPERRTLIRSSPRAGAMSARNKASVSRFQSFKVSGFRVPEFPRFCCGRVRVSPAAEAAVLLEAKGGAPEGAP
jgi:hypothetical protein